MNKNLHLVNINGDTDNDGVQHNYNCKTPLIECYFKDLKPTLLEKIEEADAIVGCIAWLTDSDILNSLKKVEYGVSIVVQKEDFLRPDKLLFNKINLNKQYNSINPLVPDAHHIWFKNTFINELCVCRSLSNEAIRCVGNHNSTKNPAFPRMHNKFIVFGKIKKIKQTEKQIHNKLFIPYAVWTGSLNFTKSAIESFENAVYIKDKDVAKAYMKEWAQIFSLSETLDWKSEYCEPQFRVGT